MGSRLYADPDKLPGTETGLGQVDDLLDVYPDIYQDLGFGEVHSWDSLY